MGAAVIDPVFWLGLSILLVAASLTAVLVVALPTLQELARAARSAEKLFDTLSRELPPTLQAIRLTGMEISDLTDEIDQGVQSAGKVARQLDQGLEGARQQVQGVQTTTQSVWIGFRAAWKTFSRPGERKRRPRHRNPRPRSAAEFPQASPIAEAFYRGEALPRAEQSPLNLNRGPYPSKETDPPSSGAAQE